MKTRRLLSAIAAAIILGGPGSALAGAPATHPKEQTQKGPGIPGQMRSTSHAERRAAAIRNADRRADHVRKHHGKEK